jgi:hypothetical protein
MSETQPKGPFRLVTVNTAPERAKRLIGRLVEALKDRYTILYVANCESVFHCLFFSMLFIDMLPTEIEEVEPKVKEHQPDVLVTSSSNT